MAWEGCLSLPQFDPTYGLLVLFVDNGEPGSVQAKATTPDQVRMDFLIAPPPRCPMELFPDPNPVLQGNYVVHDG